MRRADPNQAQLDAEVESDSLLPENLPVYERLTGPPLPQALIQSITRKSLSDGASGQEKINDDDANDDQADDDPSASVYRWLLNDDELEQVWLAIEANMVALPLPPEFDEAHVSEMVSAATAAASAAWSGAVGGSREASVAAAAASATATVAMTAAGERVFSHLIHYFELNFADHCQ